MPFDTDPQEAQTEERGLNLG